MLFLVDIAFVSRLVLFPCQLLPLTCLSGKPSCSSAPDTAFFPEVVSLTCYRLALWGEGSKQGLVGVPAPSANIDATIPGIFSLALCWSRLPSARDTAEERRRLREFSSQPLFFLQCPTLFGSGSSSSWRAAVHGIAESDVPYPLNNNIILSPFQEPWSLWEFILVFQFLKICHLSFFLHCPCNSTRQPAACVYALSCQDFSLSFKLILSSSV